MAAGHAIAAAVESAKGATAEAVGGPARLKVILLLGAVLGLDAADKAAISAVAGEKACHRDAGRRFLPVAGARSRFMA